jgi:hypothetical protein
MFWMYDLINLFGKGGSGKSSIINAIYSALSPNANITFLNSDFYKEDNTNPIRIEVTIYELSSDIRIDCRYNSFNVVINEESNLIYRKTNKENEFALTIILEIKKDLKPKWFIVGRSRKESVEIIANYREHFNILFFSFNNDGYIVCKDEKGTERPISFESILELSTPGSIMLFDNFEDGQKPDKTKRLIKSIIKQGPVQIITTSRSQRHRINL